jgi:hypothetical protein
MSRARRKALLGLVTLAIVSSGCLGEPVGPNGQIVVEVLGAPADSALIGAPGRPLSQPVCVRVTDGEGHPLGGLEMIWNVSGVNARLDERDLTTGPDGSARATWILGTRAGEIQRLQVEARTSRHRGSVGLVAVAKAVEVDSLRFIRDTLTVKLGTEEGLTLEAADPFGNLFVPASPVFSSLDTSIVTVDSVGVVAPMRRGVARVVAKAGAGTATATITVAQQLKTIVLDRDSVSFDAIADTGTVQVSLIDDLGLPIADSTPLVSSVDTNVAAVVSASPLLLRSTGVGATVVVVTIGGVQQLVSVHVNQVPAAIAAALSPAVGIASVPLDSLIPVACVVQDHNGYPVPGDPSVAPSAGGRWSGTTCSSIRIQRSGYDTLHLSVGAVTSEFPIILAVRPLASSPVGEMLSVDSFPTGTGPWAPSARINSSGQMEVYVALGMLGTSPVRSNLHRFISNDGLHFRYDGVVLQHDSVPCSLTGTGIENVAVVPRSDAPGWRMYYSAGSNDCYGWQVFSATSLDERTWVPEPGVRLSNGGPVPPDAPSTPPWPAGEGMSVERLPTGDWRMIVSTYEHTLPRVDKWQITEWRSPDQLQWNYVGIVLRTDSMPPAGQSSIYSPTIREVAPGLWRMVFTADNRGTPNARSALWSAVSTDKQEWQVEGELVGAIGSNIYYSALAGDRLVYIRSDVGQPPLVGIVTVTMP